jgi:hypothetical protein
LAVIAALSSGRWGASNLQAILEQGKVNDTWAYYQSDSMKEHAAGQIRELAAALRDTSSGEKSNAAAMDKLMKTLDAEALHESQKKDREFANAKGFEANRNRMVERGFWFEISFTALQLGVVLCTIASGAKSKGPWLIAMFFGVIGLLTLINGFHPFTHAPPAWYQGAAQQMEYQVKSPR